jgi:YfiH family protein
MKTIHNGTMEYEVAEIIAVPHGFTTRLGGVSTGIFSSLNLAFHRGDREEAVRENYRRLGVALGFDPKKLVLTRQTHSDIIRVVSSDDHQGFDHHLYPECDGLVTNTAGTALVVFTADCTPILLHDPVTGAVGAAHAGWRGTAADIGGKTVKAMVAAFGCDPQNIRAAIGPNIGPCCFETDADVPNAMLGAYGDDAKKHIRTVGNKFYVNLKEINALSLRRAGVGSIEISPSCTVCQCDRFWSHRVTQGQRGSQGAIIVCQEG